MDRACFTAISQSYVLTGTMLWPTLFKAHESFHNSALSSNPSTTQHKTFSGAAASSAAFSSEIACFTPWFFV